MAKRPTRTPDVGRVFEEYRDYIEQVASGATSREVVPDIVQNVGVKLVRHLHTFDQRSSLKTWIHRVTINAVRDYWRSQQRADRAALAAADGPPPAVSLVGNPEVSYRRAEVRDAIRRHIATQPAPARAALTRALFGPSVGPGSRARRDALEALRSAVREAHKLGE